MRRLAVLTCHEQWEGMSGEPGGATRSCERCRMSVHDVSALDSDELETLVSAASQGRTCVRMELVGGRPRLRTGLAAGLLVAALSACASSPEDNPREFTIHPGEGGLIAGSIVDHEGRPITGAIVVLQGSSGIYERRTGHQGGYAFDDLPPDLYTVQILVGKANFSRFVDLPADGQVRVNFRINPDEGNLLGMLIPVPALDVSSPSSSMRIYMDRAPDR